MSIENDSARMAPPASTDGARMSLTGHISELRKCATNGVGVTLGIVILTYLMWPLCTRFLGLIYPAGHVATSAAKLGESHLSGAIDLGTYWGIPLFATALLPFVLPGLYRRERRVLLICFGLGVILYYSIPPLAIWAISTKLFPLIRSSLSDVGIKAVATTTTVNSTLVVIVFTLLFPAAIFGARAVARRYQVTARMGRIIKSFVAVALPAAIMPLWLVIAVFFFMPVVILTAITWRRGLDAVYNWFLRQT